MPGESEIDNSSSVLFQIPPETYVDHMPLDLETIQKLTLTSKGFSFFRRNQAHSLGEVYALMNCFVTGDYDRAELIVKEIPDVIFKSVNYLFSISINLANNVKEDDKSSNDKIRPYPCHYTSCQYTSPLKYAVETNNARMQAIFLKYFQNSPERKEIFENCKKNYQTLDIYLLLERVANADYAEAEKLAKLNPDLMFQHVPYDRNSHQTIASLPEEVNVEPVYSPTSPEYISPLKLAFKNYDSYMWAMFLELVKDHPDQLELFKQQKEEQKEHYNIEPLLKAYDNYLSTYNKYKAKYHAGTEIEKTEISNMFIFLFNKVGEEQKKMPRHMLLEIFRPSLPTRSLPPADSPIIFSPVFVWDKEHDFSINKDNRPPLQYIGYLEDEECYADVESYLYSLGKETTIVRGDHVLGARICVWAGSLVKMDRDNFSRLYNTRVQELIDQLSCALEKNMSSLSL
ncbi:hypothetical protein ACFORL_03065 [Legionella dresdenensis]|uniref:Uncharacterized protein n=1 Tax=Legionella dresdenensis TaxID=450200 RepID=A0ABV8CDE5_9GAMM